MCILAFPFRFCFWKHEVMCFLKTCGVLFCFVLVAVLCPLYYYHQRHPLNYFLLGLFTVGLAFVVGLTCAFTSGK